MELLVDISSYFKDYFVMLMYASLSLHLLIRVIIYHYKDLLILCPKLKTRRMYHTDTPVNTYIASWVGFMALYHRSILLSNLDSCTLIHHV